MKRILAFGTIGILVLMYIVTLILAFTDHSGMSSWFNASLYCTVVLPVLLWIYMHCYDLAKRNRKNNNDDNDKNTDNGK